MKWNVYQCVMNENRPSAKTFTAGATKWVFLTKKIFDTWKIKHWLLSAEKAA